MSIVRTGDGSRADRKAKRRRYCKTIEQDRSYTYLSVPDTPEEEKHAELRRCEVRSAVRAVRCASPVPANGRAAPARQSQTPTERPNQEEGP